MRAFNIVNLFLIIFLLIGICLAEELIVNSSLKDVQNRCFEIVQLIDQKDSLKDMDIVLAVDNLEYNWTKNEGKLCCMVNHKNIQEIGQEIAKMKVHVANDDKDAFKVCIESLKLYCHSYLHFMGANLHNIL